MAAIGSLSYDDPTTDPSAPKTPSTQDSGIGADVPTSLYGSTFGTTMPTANSTAPSTPQPDTPAPATYVPAPATPPPATAASAVTPPATSYQDLLTQLQSTTDPTQQANLKDQLSRQVYSTLQGAGHDVEWDGDQLMVDGRPYVVGAAATTTPGAGTTDPNAVGMPGSATNPNTGIGGAPNASAVSGPGASGSSGSGYGGYTFDSLPPGVDANNPTTQQILGLLKQAGVQPGGRGAGFTDVAYWTDHPDQLSRLAADLQGTGPDQPGPDGVGKGSGGGGSSSDPSSLYSQIFGSNPAPGAAGVDVASTPALAGPSASDAFSPTAPTYVAGAAPDNSDLAGLDTTDLMSQMPQGAPTALNTTYQAPTVDTTPAPAYQFNGLGDLGTLGAGPTDAQTQDLVSQILANPESYPPEVVAQLKAQQKDELSAMAKSDEDNLTAAGYATGNQDSNWLQSEKLARAGQRDQAIVAGDQNIDLTAAKQNLADKTAAATLGSSFAQAQDLMNRADAAQTLSEKQAAEGDTQAAAASAQQAATFRQQGEEMNAQNSASANSANNAATATNNSNLFQSEDEQRQSLQLAADTTLQAAAVKNDRVSLEQGFQQKAAELGISADQVREQYALGLLSNATQQMGIQVNAATARAQLAQAGTEFQQNLIFQLAALKQANDQFGATYGVNLLNATTAANAEQFNEYNTTFGSGANTSTTQPTG